MTASRFSAALRGTALMTLTTATLGCAVGPRYHQPSAPAISGYTADLPFEWWEMFQSPELSSLIERALEANPTIVSAQAALAQAQEMVKAQRGFFYPSVGSSFQAERHKVSGNTNSSATIGVQGNGVNLLPIVPESAGSINHFPRNLPSYYTFYTAQLTVGFVPDVFGGNRRQVESLAAQADAQRFALEATYITLASTVAAAAIQEASLRAQIAATQQIITADQQSLQILRDQLKLGYAMRIDVAAQEAILEQAISTLPPLQKQLDVTLDMIRALLGTLPDVDQKTVDLDALQLPGAIPVMLPGRLIEQRPDIRAAEAQLHGANANVGVAIAAMLPEFSITGQYGGNATELSQLFSAGGPFWSLYGNVTQPIFQGGTLLHQKRAASAAFTQAAAQYQSTVITAYQNVADALHVSESDAEEFDLDVEAEKSAKLTYDLTRQQLQAGYVTYLSLLSAETAYQQTFLTRIQAQATRFGDTVALFQALGGGWWNRRSLAAK